MIAKAVAVGDKIELTKFNRDDKQNTDLIYVSQIQDIASNNSLIISAPLVNGRIIPLDRNKEFKVCVYTEMGLYVCRATVTKIAKNDKLHLIHMKMLSNMKKYQRREYYRLNCVLSFKYKDKQDNLWSEGIILDISGGGIKFTTSHFMENDTPIICNIQITVENNELKVLYIDSIVLSSNKIDDATNLYENRVKFIDISDEDRELIIKYVFEEERKRRKQKKGL